ncbi:hypothetical protein K2173_014086 [Erythroxylum novogranatense]|uniref:Expansin n=1 Tax=Erythroxylum novogranatense TaxID=1862640 RepID=A0AAV8SD83_9ROSI|nr:hypothetical protein K2173_014086 [Erythroxylum novogranatense]
MTASSGDLTIPFLWIGTLCLVLSEKIISVNAGHWDYAHATFYGDEKGVGTMDGACGYGDLFTQGYELATTALSTALFNDGSTCGACFEIICVDDPRWCIKGGGSITVTATNFCPPNYSKQYDNWCNPPLKHFDLTRPMFQKIAYSVAGIIPVRYRRASCTKRGGVKFEVGGNPSFLTVLVYNVGGAGAVIGVNIKGYKTDWIKMQRNWGQIWQTGANLVGRSLSFQVALSDGNWLQFNRVTDANWQFGRTYDGNINFR